MRSEPSYDSRPTLTGIDKQALGSAAANIRSFRPPEPYKGKGVKYMEERILLPAARRALGTTDLTEIQDRLDHPNDPLFGAPGEERFAALRQDILDWAEDAA